MLKKNRDGLLLAPRNYKTEKLKLFYENMYFQKNLSKTQKKNYNKEEIYFNELSYKLPQLFFKKKFKSILDVGCGQGYLLKYFNKLNYNCSGVDFSSFGILNHNSRLLKNIDFISCDIVNDQYFVKRKFDVIFLMNVAEHVENFEYLLKKLYKKLNKDGLMIIKVPNEFDIVHNEYLKNNNLKKENFERYNPLHHLNYFNKLSLKKSVLNNTTMKLLSIYSDFPIEIFLLNESTNYYKKKYFGEKAHDLRIKVTNLMQKKNNLKDLLHYYELSIKIGLGNTITAIFKK